jgi:hypothetical protein
VGATGGAVPDSAILDEIIKAAGAGTALMLVLYLLGLARTRFEMDGVIKTKDAQIADLKAQLERVIAEKDGIAEQRDEAVQLAQEKLVPMLGSFTATTTSLIPLLQDLLRGREARARDRSRG